MIVCSELAGASLQVSSKAQSMEAMAARGYEQHGRGFLFVKSKVTVPQEREANRVLAHLARCLLPK